MLLLLLLLLPLRAFGALLVGLVLVMWVPFSFEDTRAVCWGHAGGVYRICTGLLCFKQWGTIVCAYSTPCRGCCQMLAPVRADSVTTPFSLLTSKSCLAMDSSIFWPMTGSTAT